MKYKIPTLQYIVDQDPPTNHPARPGHLLQRAGGGGHQGRLPAHWDHIQHQPWGKEEDDDHDYEDDGDDDDDYKDDVENDDYDDKFVPGADTGAWRPRWRE